MAHTVDDIAMPLIADRLKKAGGANYDPKQNDAAVDPTDAFAAMKGEAARKFGEIEKQGNVKGAAAQRAGRVKLPTMSGLTHRLDVSTRS